MKNKMWIVVAAFFLCFGGLQMPAFAAIKGGAGFHGGFHGGFGRGFRRGVVVAPYWGFGWGPGWGWGDPWYGYPYGYAGQSYLGVERVDYGAVEFKVKPKTTKVFVDGRFLGMVNDLDHHRAYMPRGYHNIKLEAPDGQVANRSIYVAAGRTIKINERL